MTDHLPAPLVPAACDLRDYPWMPLDVRRLLTSETWMTGPAEGKVAALSLWCEAWAQLPAGSLPDNDHILAHLSQAGAAWRKVREHALRGWVKCSDGRLYHPVVAEKANEAWRLKLAQKARTEAARRAKQERKAAVTAGSGTPPQQSVTTSVTEPVTRLVAASVAGAVTESATDTVTGSTRPDSTRQDLTPPLLSPPLPTDASAQAPPPTGKRRADVGTRLPEAWHPEPKDIAFAESLGLDVAEAVAEFRDYWRGVPGAKGRKLDWSATFRNRCRDRARHHRQRSPQRPTFRNGFAALAHMAEQRGFLSAAIDHEDEVPNVRPN
jgi:hypothetical protein